MSVLYCLLMIVLSAFFSFSLIKGGCVPTKRYYWICESCLIGMMILGILRGAAI